MSGMRPPLVLLVALAGLTATLAAQNDSTGAPGGLALTLSVDQYRIPRDKLTGVTLRGIGIRREGITTAFGVGVVGSGLLGNEAALDGELGFGASGAGKRVAFLFTGGVAGLFPLEGRGGGILGVSVGGSGILGVTERVGLRLELTRRIWFKTATPNAWVLSVGIGLVPRGDWRDR